MKQKILKSSFCKATGFIAQCPGRYSVALIQDLVLSGCFIGAKVRSTESDPQPRHLLPPGAVRLCSGRERHPSGCLPACPARPVPLRHGGGASCDLCWLPHRGPPVLSCSGGPPGPRAGVRRARLLAASTLARQPAYCAPPSQPRQRGPDCACTPGPWS